MRAANVAPRPVISAGALLETSIVAQSSTYAAAALLEDQAVSAAGNYENVLAQIHAVHPPGGVALGPWDLGYRGNPRFTDERDGRIEISHGRRAMRAAK